MPSIRFIHAADLHLDAPFQSIEHFDENWMNRLKNAAWDAFEELIELAIENDVDFVILAGDIFDKEYGGSQSVYRFKELLSKLSSRGIYTYMVLGNHDLAIDHQMIRETMAGDDFVHIFSDEKVETLTYYKDGREAVEFYGRGFWDSDPEDNPTLEYTGLLEREKTELLKIAIAHGRVGEVNEILPCPSFPLRDLKKANVHYWAMGHMHKPKTFLDELPLIVNPGGIQGVNMNEKGPMGCYYSEWNGSHLEKIQFYPLQKIRWEQISFHFNDDCLECDHACSASMEEVASCIYKDLEGIYHEIGKPLIIQLILEGKTTEYFRLREKKALDHLKKKLSNHHFIVVDVIDYTIPNITLDDSSNLKFILGEFISLVARLKEIPLLYEELEVKHSYLYGNDHFQKTTGTGSNQRGRGQWKVKKLKTDRFHWLEEAKKLGIDTLLSKDGDIFILNLEEDLEKEMLRLFDGHSHEGVIFDLIEKFEAYDREIASIVVSGVNEEKITHLYQKQRQVDDELFQAVKEWTLLSIVKFAFEKIRNESE